MKHFFSNKIYNVFWVLKHYLGKGYYSVRNRMCLNAAGIEYSKDLVINGKILVGNMGRITIGSGVVINSGSYPNPVGHSPSRLYTYDKDSVLEIGNNVGISNALIFSRKKIIIGNNTLIGAETTIIDNDFHNLRTEINGDVGSSPIIIGSNSFIGARCIILKGSSIGDNVVVGAGSVVTSDIPDNEIWAGNPARFIRKND